MFEKKYTLLRSQKKRVYDILREIGLEPAEFSWSEERIVELLSVSRLSYRDGQDYYFQFSSYEINAWCIACPGQYRTMDYRYPKNWEEQEAVFWNWAETLKAELETPDPWKDLAKYRLVTNGELSGDAVNEPIAAVEAEQIGQALMRVGDVAAAELSLGDEQAALLRARLDYLAEAARRERSRDWVYTTMGVWTSLGVALSLTEEQGATLWGTLRRELGSFATFLPAKVVVPPPPPPKKSVLGLRSAFGRPPDHRSDKGASPHS